ARRCVTDPAEALRRRLPRRLRERVAEAPSDARVPDAVPPLPTPRHGGCHVHVSLILAGYFPGLRPMPKLTPGYQPPRVLELPGLGHEPLPDLRGQVFGELTVAGPATSTPRGRVWPCACSCGRSRHVSTHDLVRGAVRSCGHLLRAPRTAVSL